MEVIRGRDLTKINAEGADGTLGWFFWACQVTTSQNKSIHNTLSKLWSLTGPVYFDCRSANMESSHMHF